MRLRVIIASVTVLISFNSIARSQSKSTFLSVTSFTEEEAVEKAQSLIPSIKYATNKRVISFGNKNRCTFRKRRYNKNNRISVYGVTITKMYKLKREVLESYYRAKIKYTFHSCRTSRND